MVGVPTYQLTFLTGGIFHVPSIIGGSLSSGQYMRSMNEIA